MWIAWLLACESTAPSGHVFSPVEADRAPLAAAAPADPELSFPTTPPLTLSSEQLAKGTVAPATAAAVDPDKLAGAEEPMASATASAPAPAAPPAVGVPAAAQFPVRLLSTLPQAQPPRAILGLPSGQEAVVTPGSILGEQGLVVMSVTAGKVQLAKISPAGDHALIESIELSAQY